MNIRYLVNHRAKEYFSSLSNYSNENILWRIIRRAEEKKISESLFAIGSKASVLDLGCGCGKYTDIAAKACTPSLSVAVDFSKNMLSQTSYVHQRVQSNIEFLPFRRACFDMVICIGAMEFNYENMRIVKEAMRVLKVGGNIVLFFPYKNLFYWFYQTFHAMKGNEIFPVNEKKLRFLCMVHGMKVCYVKKAGLFGKIMVLEKKVSGMKILWIINGLGMGNTTRCDSIMEHLNAELGSDVEHVILSNGNGFRYFKAIENKEKRGIASIIELPSCLDYKTDESGKIDVWKTILGVVKNIRGFIQSNQVVNDTIKIANPDIIVTDSTYFFLRKGAATHIAVNNADVVRAYFKKLSWGSIFDISFKTLMQYVFVEYPDYLYHKLVPDFVISPVINKESPSFGTMRDTGKYYRRGFHVNPFCRLKLLKASKKSRKRKKRVNLLLMFTGSEFCGAERDSLTETLNDFVEKNRDVYIDVVGSIGEAPWIIRAHKNIAFHSKMVNNIPVVARADICVVNAGFSAIGEMCVLGKTYAVLPIENHFEQLSNSRLAREASSCALLHGISEFGLNKLLEQYLKQKDGSCQSVESGSQEAAKIISCIGQWK